jgi:hypothetical protein
LAQQVTGMLAEPGGTTAIRGFDDTFNYFDRSFWALA